MRLLNNGGQPEAKDALVALLETEHKQGKVWVLPKGHVELEENEAVSSAARREVEEEVGLSDLAVKDQLGTTRFTFQAEDAVIKKTVHYYLMITNQEKLTPEDKDFIFQAKWFAIDEAIKILAYDTDQEIVYKAGVKLGIELVKPIVKRPKRRPAKRGRAVSRTRRASRSGRSPRIHS